jgi:hypothetical protein
MEKIGRCPQSLPIASQDFYSGRNDHAQARFAQMRWQLAFVFAAAISTVSSLPANLAVDAAETPSRSTDPPPNEQTNVLNLPADFVRRTRHRLTFDQYAQRFHAVAGSAAPAGRPPAMHKPGDDRFIRPASTQTPEPIVKYRLAQERRQLPLRGFRAAILDEAGHTVPTSLPWQGFTAARRKAADLITRRLAHDGLISTLVEVVAILGPQSLLDRASDAAQELSHLGFPADWLVCFKSNEPQAGANTDLISHTARLLLEGKSVASAKEELKTLRFEFHRNGPEFRVAPENGEDEIALVRMQVEGGYLGGIVPGDSLDVTAQIVAALPEADFLVTIQDNFATNLHWLAQHCWPLKRANQLTLLAEKCDVTPWAQDNGKAGFTALKPPGAAVPATLAPRYASQGEDVSQFMPGDSYLMDGLRAAGHAVIQSPLLFQGGNLLAVRDPVAKRRVLLISEAEIYRNTPLGLTREQVLEAFRAEFGVEACVVLPVVSHHLDFDFTVRTHGGQVLAFVNDPQTAVRLILERAVAALEANRSLTPDDAKAARAHLREGKNLVFAQTLTTALQRHLNRDRQYPSALTRAMAVGRSDSAAANFQCFLAALDLHWAAALTEATMPSDSLTRNYFTALRELEEARQTQIRALQKLGWKVVPVPSLPDMHRTINYVNGLHDRRRYLMPAFGGFYAFLDEAARNAFAQALGPEVALIPIFTAVSQRNHGAVHCAASAYPRLSGAKF